MKTNIASGFNKIIGALTLVMVFCMAATTAFAQKKTELNTALADSLANWVTIDQIAANVKPATGRFANMDQQQWALYKDSVFTTHQKILDKIFNQYGYPGYDLVGKKGSNHFWLMVQHCDKNPDFQRKILTAMKKEVDKGNADPKNFAYLTDRVNLNTGHKQLYGTQVTYNLSTCQAFPRPVADSSALDERRKQVGLEPINVYLNQMSEFHFTMNREVYEKKGIYKAKLYPVAN
jgi:hypothetical protein